MLNTVYAPDTVTEGETFLWHNVDRRLQVGVAYLWKQNAYRGLANYELVPETANRPNLRVGFGLQGISTGNPGYFVTSEKNAHDEIADVSVFFGIGARANESHGHLIGGFKITPYGGDWTLGMQMDGHANSPFVTYRVAPGVSIGYYSIDMKVDGFMLTLAK